MTEKEQLNKAIYLLKGVRNYLDQGRPIKPDAGQRTGTLVGHKIIDFLEDIEKTRGYHREYED